MPPLNKFQRSSIAIAVCPSLFTPIVQAATILVNAPINNPSGGCNLIEAIKTANSSLSLDGCTRVNDGNIGHTILMPADSTQTLVTGAMAITGNTNDFTGLPFIESEITIQGNGSTIERVSSDPFRLFALRNNTSGNLTLHDLTLTGGSFSSSSSYQGGAIYVGDDTELTLHKTTVTGNNTGQARGGAIFAKGNIYLYNSQISGNSANTTSVDSARGGGIYADGANVTLSSTNVLDNSGRFGGGVFMLGGSISLSNSVLSGNYSTNGGGGAFISTGSNLTATRSTISSNSSGSFGAGIASGGAAVLNLTDCKVVNNSSGFAAGISARSSSVVTVINSTVSRNSATYGAGVDARTGAVVNLTNSTISSNTADTRGGGVLTFTGGSVSLNNSTVSNHLGGGIAAYGNPAGGTISLKNSIVANSTGPDCTTIGSDSRIFTDSASIVEDGTCSANRFGNPGLQTLANNGGINLTHALESYSIARDSSNGVCPAKDQRGKSRDLSDGFCDIGAVEFDANDGSGFIVIPLGVNKVVVVPN